MEAELNSTERTVLYLYGVTEFVPENPVRQVGVDRKSPVEAVECDAVVCWVSRVSGREFETSLAQNMENLDWLAAAGVAHQRAIGRLARVLEILPARFGTIFRDERSLCAHVRGRLRELQEDFQRVRDADEWGVKVFETAPAPAPAQVPNIRSGKAYLMAKAALVPPKRQILPPGELAAFKAALGEVAEESAPAGSISRGQRGLTFQTSLLVKRPNQRRLQSVLKQFTKKWAGRQRIECTGPWPPYSFVSQPAGAK